MKFIVFFFSLTILLNLCILASTSPAVELNAKKISNLEVIQMLAMRICDSIQLKLPSIVVDTLYLSFIPIQDIWVIEHAFTRRLLENLKSPIKSGLSYNKFSMEAAILRISIEYTNSFKENIFATKKIKRLIELEIGFKLTYQNEIMIVKSFCAQYFDTVKANSIKDLENNDIPITRGNFIDELFLERFFFPAIILSSIGVLVYLFFNIRK